jgi:hypothetical protein
MKKLITLFKSHSLPIIFLLLLSIWMGKSFVSQSIAAGHDIEVHGVRLINYYLAVKQGQFPPQWAPNMNFGFGYPVFIYSYQLPYFLGALFFAATTSVELSLNLVYLLSIGLAISGTYVLAATQQKDKKVSLLATLLYVLSPYYLLTLYIRGALAEALFLSILPWALTLYSLKNRSSLFLPIVTILITTALLLSHHVSLLLAVPIIGLWIGFQSLLRRDTLIVMVQNFIPLLISILLAGFYWVPSLLEANLIEVAGTTHTSASLNFLNITDIPWMLWDCQDFCYSWVKRPVPTFLGISQLAVLLITTLVVFYQKIKLNLPKQKIIFWLGLALVSTYLVLPASFPLWKFLRIISMIEFPWLLLWIPTISAVFCVLYLGEKFFTKKSFLSTVLIACVLGQSLYALLFWTKPIGYFSKHLEDWLHFGDITTNYDGLLPKSFDSHANLRLDEPVIVRLKDQKTYPEPSQAEPELQGETSIQSWVGSSMVYTVTATQSAYAVQRTAYFPGWHAYVNDTEVEILHSDAEFPGRILVPVGVGTSTVKVVYRGDTLVRSLGKTVSLSGLLLVVAYSVFLKLYLKKSS